MQPHDYLRHLRLMKEIRTLGPLQRQFWEELLVKMWIWQQPYASATDLLVHEVLILARLYEILEFLRNGGYVEAVRLGSMRKRQTRYYLTPKGVNSVRETLGWPLEWQVMKDGLERISRFVPFLEVAYRLSPRLWGSAAAAPLQYPRSLDPERPDVVSFDESCVMYRFNWVRHNPSDRKNSIHVVTQYVNEDLDEVAVPYCWYGRLHGPGTLPDLASLFLGLQSGDAPASPEYPVIPPGAVFVCADRLAALRVQREYAPHIPKAVVTTDGRVVEVMRPGVPRRLFRMAEQPAGRRPQPPQGIPEWLAESAHGGALDGVENTRVFSKVEDYQGSLITQVARGARIRRDTVRKMLDVMAQHDLVRELEGGYYLGDGGIKFIARRDRESIPMARSRFSTYIEEDGRYRAQQRRHDRKTTDVAIRFQEAGLTPFTGRRMVVNYPHLTQIKPDLWCVLALGDGTVLFVAVEVEFSAKKDKAISDKLLPYRVVQFEIGEPVPVLFVTGTPDAADRVARLGDDLNLLAASYDEVMKNRPDGPIWRWRGQRVTPFHLANLGTRNDLIQAVGRQLGYPLF